MEDIIQQLASGQSCDVHGCHLSPDGEHGLIWGTDPYGIDFIASKNFSKGSEAAAKEAIERARQVADGENMHDRMYLIPAQQ